MCFSPWRRHSLTSDQGSLQGKDMGLYRIFKYLPLFGQAIWNNNFFLSRRFFPFLFRFWESQRQWMITKERKLLTLTTIHQESCPGSWTLKYKQEDTMQLACIKMWLWFAKTVLPLHRPKWRLRHRGPKSKNPQYPTQPSRESEHDSWSNAGVSAIMKVRESKTKVIDNFQLSKQTNKQDVRTTFVELSSR